MTPAPISVERLRELLDKATPGPWIIDTNETYSIRDKDGGRFVLMTHLLGRNGEGGRRSPNEVAATLRLIVAMREALPALLQQLAELERDNATMRGADYHQVGVEQEQEIIDLEAKLAEREAEVEREQGVREDAQRQLRVALNDLHDMRWMYAQELKRAEAAERAREELRTAVLRMHAADEAYGCGFYGDSAWIEAYDETAFLATSGGA